VDCIGVARQDANVVGLQRDVSVHASAEAALLRGDDGEGVGRAHQEGRAVSDAVQVVGQVAVDDHEAVGALEFADRATDADDRVLGRFVVVREEMGDDLGVGLGQIGVRGEVRFQRFTVLYDAVVDDHEALVVGEVRMGVLVRLGSVRRPAVVTNARGQVPRRLFALGEAGGEEREGIGCVGGGVFF